MPIAEMTRPPHQHSADTKPALRGPTRSSQPPHKAADEPSSTKNNVYIQPRSATDQSQLVVNSEFRMLEPAGQAIGFVTPSDWLNGSQNTLKPYAIPMQR
jgi:hypothetical protein